MCGIAAMFHYGSGQPPEAGEILRIRDAMSTRGPDGSGQWASPDGRVRLAHRRLSVIDLSAKGAQPMEAGDSGLVITFNGEIYNHRELRRQLEGEGCRFQSASDTEVLLRLYAARGPALVHELRGMYAFALWDASRRGLFLARDPFGIKPLYYADDGAAFRAASQVKALLAGGQIDRSPEPAGHVGFFLWGHVPSPYTMYRGIRSLPAGTSLWIDEAGARTQTTFCNASALFTTAEAAMFSPGNADSAGAQRGGFSSHEARTLRRDSLRASLAATVRRHLEADVPIVVFLSSGLDSASIAALAARQARGVQTLTLGFEAFKNKPQDETAGAIQIARCLGADHRTVWLDRQDFEVERHRFFAAMDQPSIDGANTYFISLAANRAGFKVALSGLGGDELLGGYPSFREVPRTARVLAPLRRAPGLGTALRILSGPAFTRLARPKYAGLFEYGGSFGGAYLLRRGLFMPWELPALLDRDLVQAGWQELQPLARLEDTLHGLQSPRLKVSCLESTWYMHNQLLRDADWAGMAHSVEIRLPLVDVDVVREVAWLSANGDAPSKQDMARCCDGAIPAAILNRPKTGFSVPLRQWLGDGDQPEGGWFAGRGQDARTWARYVYAQFVSG